MQKKRNGYKAGKNHFRQPKKWKPCFLALFFAFLLLYSWNRYSADMAKTQKSIPYNIELYKLLGWIKSNTNENDVILSHWEFSPFVYGIAGRSVVVTSKVYPSESSIVAGRYKDLSKFFFSTDENNAMGVVKKYNITYVAVQKNFNLKVCRYIGVCRSGNSYGNSMIFRLLSNKNLQNFKLVYSSKNFKVYKVAPFSSSAQPNYGYWKEYADKDIKSYLKQGKPAKKDYQSKGIIIPHDILHAGGIVMDNLGSIRDGYDKIIIMGPDHFSRGMYPISSADISFQGFSATMKPDLGTINELGLPLDDKMHQYEHSIRILVPYMQYWFGNATIIPILFRYDVNYSQAVDFGKELAGVMDDKTLLVASIDFSHVIPANQGINKIEDGKTLEALSRFDKQKIYSLNTEGRPILAAFLAAMEEKNATKAYLLNMSSQPQPKGSTTQSVGYLSIQYAK